MKDDREQGNGLEPGGVPSGRKFLRSEEQEQTKLLLRG